jgi:hypothetical protein
MTGSAGIVAAGYTRDALSEPDRRYPARSDAFLHPTPTQSQTEPCEGSGVDPARQSARLIAELGPHVALAFCITAGGAGPLARLGRPFPILMGR